MDEMRCTFCGRTEAQIGRLYTSGMLLEGAPRPPARICVDCSESINFMIRTDLAYAGRTFETEAEFPPIASHRFPLRGPNGEDAEMCVEIAAPYTIDDHTAHCPVSITGPIPVAWHHVGGAGTLQALCLAISSAYNTLAHLDRQGWKWTAPHADVDILFGRKTARAT